MKTVFALTLLATAAAEQTKSELELRGLQEGGTMTEEEFEQFKLSGAEFMTEEEFENSEVRKKKMMMCVCVHYNNDDHFF